MLVSINGVDLTPYINPKNYKMNANRLYSSWEDGNFREHRIYTRNKVEGSFDIALYGKDDMTTQSFLDTWMGGVNNNIATLSVFVQNMNENQTIEAYFEFSGAFHREMINGEYCDVMTIKITEK